MKIIIKKIKQLIIGSILASSVIIASNSNASNYIDDAKQHMGKGEYKAAIIQLKNQLKETPKDARARLLLGKSYLKTGNIKQADKEITRAYQIEPASEDVTLAYAQMLLLKKDYKKIHNILDKKFSDANKENQRQIYVADALLGQNQLADAKEILSDLATKDENIQVYNGLAKIALLEKEMDIAKKWLTKSLQKEPENFNTLKIKAELDIANKNFTEVLSIYNKLIQQQEYNLSLYLKRAAIQIELKDFKNAEKDIKKVLERIQNQPSANFMLAQIKLREKNYKAAKGAAQNVLNVVPQHYPSMLLLGVANLVQGHFNQAEKYITQYLYSNPDNLYVQNLLANLYLGQGKSEQALLFLEDIDEEKMAQNSQLLTTLGSAYLLQGEHEKGIEALKQAKALEPDSEVLQKKLVIEQYRTGDVDNAILGMEKMVNSGRKNKQIKYLLIISYVQQKELEKAKVLTNNLLNETPDEPRLYNVLAIIEKLSGNSDKAVAAYNKSLQLDNNNIPAYIGLAQLAIAKNNLNQAKEYLNNVLLINSQYIRAYTALAGIAEKENNPQAVEKYLITGFENVSGNVKAQVSMALILGKWYIKQKQPQKLLLIAQQLNKTYPDNLAALSFMARAEMTNNKASAEQTLYKIINENKKDTKHRLVLADLLAKQSGRENEVIKLLDEVIDILPDNLTPVALKAAYLINIQQYQQAMDVADHIQKHFSGLALGSELKGGIYLKQKNYDKALENYQQAYKIRANNKLLITIAEILISQGKEADVIKLFADELQKDDDNYQAHFILATLYQKNDKYDEAIKHYQIILDNNNANVLALNNLAWIYEQQNNPQALNLAKKAYEKEPNYSLIADTYGYILVKKGHIEDGITILEKAAKQAPQANNIQFHLAEAYYLSGDNHKAKTILETILSSNKDFSEKDNVKNLLEKVIK